MLDSDLRTVRKVVDAGDDIQLVIEAFVTVGNYRRTFVQVDDRRNRIQYFRRVRGETWWGRMKTNEEYAREVNMAACDLIEKVRFDREILMHDEAMVGAVAETFAVGDRA
jgi:hypothetical protein